MGWPQIIQIIILIVSSYMAYKNRPKTPDQVPATIEDINIPQIDEGTPIAVTFGDCWASNWMVLGLGNFRTTPIRTKGGKK